jgi:hypothetical protein
VNGGTIDNCPGNLTYDPIVQNYNCSNVGNNNYTLTVTDPEGNSSTCVATVTVRDVKLRLLLPPVRRISLLRDARRVVPALTGQVTATDNCGIAEITQNPALGVVVSNGTTVVISVRDNSGNTVTCC